MSDSAPVYVFPASHQQQRLWFLDRLVAQSPFYNVPTAARLHGPVDPDSLARAIDRLVERHETLRTTFAFDGDSVTQQVHTRIPVALVRLDLSQSGGRPEEIERIARAEARRPFDLETGPLVRATLLRCADSEHVLLFTLHHIVADGWSLGLLLRDLAALYRAETEQVEPELPELEIQYADYAAWQREQLRGPELESQVEYWRERLGSLPELTLPCDRPRPKLPSFEGAVETFRIAPDCARRLEPLCGQERATPFMALSAAFALVLAQHGGEREVALGTPVAHRSRAELENLVGFFVNTLVLRARIELDDSFRTLLQRFRTECLGAYAHQDVPFELLVEMLEPERDLGRNPLFQVMVVLHNQPTRTAARGVDAPRVRFEPQRVDTGTAKFDLQLFLTESDGGFDASLEYSCDLFDRETVQSLVERFLHLLEQVSCDPERELRGIDPMPSAELEQVIHAWNRTDRKLELETSLTTHVERGLSRDPEQEAIRFEGVSLSRGELDRRASRLAHELRARGIGRDARVGICLERSPELMITLLGVLKAGAAYVPFEPDLPDARLRTMCRDAGASCVLTASAHAERLDTPQVLSVDAPDFEAALARHAMTPPVRTEHPDQLAYVIYTSGSTGRPKGVGVSHRAIVNRLLWMQEEYALDASDRVLQKTPIGFDVSVWELFWPLMAGAPLVLARPDGHRDPTYLAELLRAERITTLHFVPSMLRSFLEDERTGPFPEIRRVITSGEALTAELAGACLERVGGRLFNLYGPTETAVDVTAEECRSDALAADPAIGRPIANLRCYVLDADGRPVPPGVQGELYLGGVGLARGYLGQPGTTASAFVPDPFSGEPGARLYRTGDRVRQSRDGRIHFLGRRDAQVKLRGQRIELAEIEAALGAVPGVRDAVVQLRSDPDRLVAFVRGEPPQGDSGRLRAELVSEWRELYDDLYARPDTPDIDPDLDTRGWIRSHDGEPYPPAAMREWVETTVAAVRALGPRSILEIGCGNGLLLRELAPHCEHYAGSDLSSVAIERLAHELGDDASIDLVCQPAHAPWPSAKSVDLVLLNSVVQYFPGERYLLEVLERAVEQVVDGGSVFIGDLRVLPWLELLHLDVAAHRASPTTRLRELRREVSGRVRRDAELVVSPFALAAELGRWPRVAHVEVRLKTGTHDTEMNRFRCDVVVHVGPGATRGAQRGLVPVSSEAFEPGPGARERVDARLARGARAPFAIASIPNAHLTGPLQLLEAIQGGSDTETLADLQRRTERAPGQEHPDEQEGEPGLEHWSEHGHTSGRSGLERDLGLTPGWLIERARKHRLEARIYLDRSDPSRFSAVFFKTSEELPPLFLVDAEASDATAQRRAGTHSSALANDPLRERLRRSWVAGLRGHLGEVLPEAWIPTQIGVVDEWPLTASGKLDRAALPEPEAPASSRAFVAPRSTRERILAEIWCDVLGVDRVGAHDGFFELGGDSILSIQLVQRAREQGLALRVRDVFEHPTLAALASMAGESRLAYAPQTAFVGSVPWTPVARAWQALRLPEPHHWNQAILLEVPKDLDRAALERATGALLAHHDLLRLRLREGSLEVVPPLEDTGESSESFETLLIDASTGAERIEAECARLQATLDLEAGPVLRAMLLECAEGETDRLLLVAHHLAVDAVSWRILIEDLARGYVQAHAGRSVRLAARTTPFAHYAARLLELAGSDELAAERSYWERPALPPLPIDHDHGPPLENTSDQVRVSLPAELVNELQGPVARAFRMRIDELLLAAFARSLARWCGRPELDIEVEGHGRDAELGDVDPSRTVGWFTTQYPVRLCTGSDLAGDFCAVKETLRAVPRQGLGYGLLRHSAELLATDAPEIGFNYFGRLDLQAPSGLPVRGAPERLHALRAGSGVRPYSIDLNALLRGGELELRLSFSQARHRHATVEKIAADLQSDLEALVELCTQAETRSQVWRTPSDFPLAGLDAEALDELLATYPQLDDVYPLTPLQEGLWLHSRFAPRAGLYLVQLRFRIRGPIDPAAFQEAWSEITDRHPVLRTAIFGDGMRPLQVVQESVELPFEHLDLRDVPASEREARVERWLEADQDRAFDFEQAPLQRLALLELGPGESLFVWTHHHVILDGWSVPVVLAEVLAAYEATRRSTPVALPAPAPFRDYVGWLARRDAGADREAWRAALRGFDTTTPVPLAEPVRANSESEAVQRHARHVSGCALDAIEDCARSLQITLSTVIEAAWALLLARHASRDDVVFGIAVSGRPAELPHPEGRVGMFVHTLPVRVRASLGEPISSWLVRLQQQAAALRDRAPTPLVEIHRASDVPSGAPLFETLVAFENYPRPTQASDGPAELELVEFSYRDRTHYPLLLVASRGESDLRLELASDPTRVTADATDLLLERLVAILESMTADPSQCVGRVRALTRADRDRLESEVSTRSLVQRAPEAMQAGVERSALLRPDTVAITTAEGALTYRELDSRANQLAHRLRSSGIGPEARVGLQVERGIHLAVGVVGILKAGAAYVPLDPELPAERLAFILADADVAALVTQSGLASNLDLQALGPIPTLLLDEDPGGDAPPDPPPLDLHPDALAYVIYTSGSTGTPKGVAIGHRQVSRLLETTQERFHFTSDDVFSCAHSAAFDFSVFELAAAWHCGGRAVLLTDAERRAPERFAERLERERVTVLCQTPTAFYALAQALDVRPLDLALRWVVFGGEDLDASRLVSFAERWPEARCVNMYGITETTVHVTFHELDVADLLPPPTPIGEALDDLELHVLDAGLWPVPPGSVGELYVGGAGLARGYVGRPGLTAERFVPHPQAALPGARLYRTGDLVRQRADGALEYRGRCDRQIQLRGHRIELGEIEAHLAAHPDVHEACVLVHAGPPARLVACCTARGESAANEGGREATPESLRTWLAARLPAYMAPAEIHVLDDLPVTSNGKVDRGRLLAQLANQARSGHVEPSTETERYLAELWSELLGTTRVGARDDFFELGGHSLLAAQLIKRIERDLEVALDLRALFGATRLHDLAAAIDVQRAQTRSDALDRIESLLEDLEVEHG